MRTLTVTAKAQRSTVLHQRKLVTAGGLKRKETKWNHRGTRKVLRGVSSPTESHRLAAVAEMEQIR